MKQIHDTNMDYKSREHEMVKQLVESYLMANYNLSLENLNSWFGYKLCNFVTYLKDEEFKFLDYSDSNTVQMLTNDINSHKAYNFEEIGFEPGDVVVDIGANMGITSIFLAKKYPFLKIYAFEPVKLNYNNFLKNIEQNGIPEGTITVERKAVTADGRNVDIMINPNNTNAGRICTKPIENHILRVEDKGVESITLDEIIKKHEIKKIKLLKIDCEGAEYEIFENAQKQTLRKIVYLKGEFHQNEKLLPGKSIKELFEYCYKYIPHLDILQVFA